jgi:hypothetical protein
MKFNSLLFFFIFAWHFINAQLIFENSKNKEITFKYSIPVWSVDELQNLYLIQGNTIVKCDSNGNQLFSQSIKSIGNVSQIEPINALKIAIFSEDQQCICLFDNTLSLNGKCKYFDEYGIKNAKLIASSNRPNLFWIYDQFNSSLFLIDIISNKLIQKVENIKGQLFKDKSELEVEKIIEYNNHLYLSDSKETIFQFDQLMTLSREYQKHSEKFTFWRNQLVEMEENSIWITSLLNNDIKSFNNQNKNVREIKINGKYFYFSRENKISRFTIKID